MAGQVWVTNTLGGYMGSPRLSEKLRFEVQPICRFRQFCDIKEAVGYHNGDTYHWNVYSNVKTKGGTITEDQVMPETNFEISQSSLTITEYGNSVPFTSKLDDLSVHSVEDVIKKVLKNDARDALDTASHAEFDKTKLQAVGDANGGITLATNGTPGGANAGGLTTKHVKAIADTMEERNIPTYDGENYMAVARPTTLRPFKDELEQIRQYTPEGYTQIMFGEKGRYEGIRFIQQTNIPSENWASGKSDAAYFFGSDTVAEAMTIPEEVRGKLPGDYGRSHGIAWYALLGFGISHTDETQTRIIKWASNDASKSAAAPKAAARNGGNGK